MPASRIAILLIVFWLFQANSKLCFSQSKSSTLKRIPTAHIDNLIQGRLYKKTYYNVRGSQYLDPNWRLGTVDFLDQQYHGFPLWYDLFIDEAVLLYQQEKNLQFIQLPKQLLKSFTLENRQFINITYSPFRDLGLKSGFYELVFSEKVSFLIKRKIIQEDQESVSTFVRKDEMYLIIRNHAHRLRKKKSLISILTEQERKEIQLFLRREKIYLQKGDEVSWLRIVEYLDQLQPS